MKILIGDDSSLILEILVAAFHRAGIETISAQNGAEVLKLAMKIIPDAVLMDYAMPMLDGLAVLRQLRATPSTKNIRVYLLSGFSDSRIKQRVMESGANGFFTKPFEIHELVEYIRMDLISR